MSPARAPYNFVPLAKTVITIDESSIDGHDRYWGGDQHGSERTITGTIDFTITTEAPVWIGGRTGPESFRLGDGTPGLPGSALRGPISALFEIVTWSKIRYVDDALLFYRRIPRRPTDELGQQYISTLAEAKGAWIEKQGSRYVMLPAQAHNNATAFQCPPELLNALGHKCGWMVGDYFRERVSFVVRQEDVQRGPTTVREWRVFRLGTDNIWVSRSENVVTDETPVHGETIVQGAIIRSGPLPGVYKRDWVIPNPTGKPVPLNDDFVEAYIARSGGITQEIENHQFSVLPGVASSAWKQIPGFYLQRDHAMIVCGHTRYFRIQYRRRMSEAIPEDMRDPSALDMTDAVFGYTPATGGEGRKGRVRFEDARLCSDAAEYDAGPHRPLYSPRPTSYQHYLEQPHRQQGRGRVLHWDAEDAAIRGHKLYWRRNLGEDGWRKRDGDPDPQGGSGEREPIKPLKTNRRFSGRIQFTNLRLHELGALLFVLDLPEGCCHQVGFGKPIGMGTVKIADITVSETLRRERYTELIDGDGAFTDPRQQVGVATAKEAFATWMLERLGIAQPNGTTAVDHLWSQPRLDLLRKLLACSPPEEAWIGDYMSYDDHEFDNVLPYPDGRDHDGADGGPGGNNGGPQRARQRPQVPRRQNRPRNDMPGLDPRGALPARQAERPQGPVQQGAEVGGKVTHVTNARVTVDCGEFLVQVRRDTIGDYVIQQQLNRGEIQFEVVVRVTRVQGNQIEGRIIR